MIYKCKRTIPHLKCGRLDAPVNSEKTEQEWINGDYYIYIRHSRITKEMLKDTRFFERIENGTINDK